MFQRCRPARRLFYLVLAGLWRHGAFGSQRVKIFPGRRQEKLLPQRRSRLRQNPCRGRLRRPPKLGRR